jgi:hypothetical protein
MVRISLSKFFCIVLLCFTSLSCLAYSRAEYDRTLPTPMKGPKECCQRLKSAANEVAKFFASNTKEGCIFRQPSFVFDEIVS